MRTRKEASSLVVPRGYHALRMNLIRSLTQHHFWLKNQYLKTISAPLPSGRGMLLQIRPVAREEKWDENHQYVSDISKHSCTAFVDMFEWYWQNKHTCESMILIWCIYIYIHPLFSIPLSALNSLRGDVPCTIGGSMFCSARRLEPLIKIKQKRTANECKIAGRFHKWVYCLSSNLSASQKPT